MKHGSCSCQKLWLQASFGLLCAQHFGGSERQTSSKPGCAQEAQTKNVPAKSFCSIVLWLNNVSTQAGSISSNAQPKTRPLKVESFFRSAKHIFKGGCCKQELRYPFVSFEPLDFSAFCVAPLLLHIHKPPKRQKWPCSSRTHRPGQCHHIVIDRVTMGVTQIES